MKSDLENFVTEILEKYKHEIDGIAELQKLLGMLPKDECFYWKLDYTTNT